MIVDSHFGWTRMDTNSEQPELDRNIGRDVLGIPGTNGTRRFEGGWPRFQFPNNSFATFGATEGYMPYYRSDPQYQYVANLGWIKGAHNIRLGMDLYRQHLNHTQPEHYTETSQLRVDSALIAAQLRYLGRLIATTMRSRLSWWERLRTGAESFRFRTSIIRGRGATASTRGTSGS